MMKTASTEYIDNMPAEDRKKYAGHWIVIVDDTVVCHAEKQRDTWDIIDKYDNAGDIPLVQYVYEEDLPLLL